MASLSRVHLPELDHLHLKGTWILLEIRWRFVLRLCSAGHRRSRKNHMGQNSDVQGMIDSRTAPHRRPPLGSAASHLPTLITRSLPFSIWHNLRFLTRETSELALDSQRWKSLNTVRRLLVSDVSRYGNASRAAGVPVGVTVCEVKLYIEKTLLLPSLSKVFMSHHPILIYIINTIIWTLNENLN